MSKTIGSLVIDLAATEVSAEEAELIAHPLVGGIILFTRNYSNFQQLSHLCQKIRGIKKSPILLMVDQEGGRVQRFKKPSFTELPAMGSLGKLYDEAPEKACHLAETLGQVMASEVLSAGIDLSFAPVLDLNSPECSVIGDRAFHFQPHIVILLAKYFIAGMQRAGMVAVGKHFPGHGLVPVDSHVATPRDNRDLAALETNDLIPFQHFITSDIPALMMAHIIFPQIDQYPVSLSGYWLRDILRKKYKFRGTIFSDDLNMEGANISTNYADRVLMARDAGCDFTLVCNNREGVIQVLNEVDAIKHQVIADKWCSLKGKIPEVANN